MAFTCNKCGLKLAYRTGLWRHMREIHERNLDTPKFTCTKCGKSYSRKHCLERHFFCKHTRPKIPTSAVRLESSSSSLHQPSPSMSGQCPPPPPPASAPPKYQCTVCGESYVRFGNLIRHFKSHHATERSRPPTSTPTAESSSLSGQRPPSPPLKYQCPNCEKSYVHRKSLVRHEMFSHDATGSTATIGKIESADNLEQTEKSRENALREAELETANILMTMSGASTSTTIPPDTPHPYGNDQSRIPPDLPARVQRWMDEESINQDMSTSSSSCSLIIDCDPLEDHAVDSRSSSPTID